MQINHMLYISFSCHISISTTCVYILFKYRLELYFDRYSEICEMNHNLYLL